MSSIPFNDLGAAYRAQQPALDSAALRVLASGWYILGREVEAFEAEFAAWLGVAGCAGVNSGTDALVLALRALEIGPGDEVITVAHTAVATVAAIELAGATPVLVDVDDATCTMDPAAAEAAITPRTKALIPVHLYGQPADLGALLDLARRHDLRLIEDCAQAHGATWQGRRVGAFGDAACFSFYPTKNLGALGDGGAVVSQDPALIERVRRLREYGWTPAARYVSQEPGLNSRLDELQAALLRVKLAALEAENARRVQLAALYSERLRDVVITPVVRPGANHVYHLYVIRTPQREAVQAHLRAHGIGSAIHYPVPIHLQPAYRGRVATGDLRRTEALANEILSLPMHPYLEAAQVEQVAAAVREALPA